MDSDIRQKLQQKLNELNKQHSVVLQIQSLLDKLYTQGARVKRLKGKQLYIETSSASLANEIRLRQVSLLDNINTKLDLSLDKVVIKIS